MGMLVQLALIALVANSVNAVSITFVGKDPTRLQYTETGNTLGVSVGEGITLSCLVGRYYQGKSSPWSFNGKLVTGDQRRTITEYTSGTGKQYRLNIQSITAEDVGNYICQGSGSDRDNVDLYLLDPPTPTPTPTPTLPPATLTVRAVGTVDGSVAVKPGATATLKCESVSNPKVEQGNIEWFKDSVSIPEEVSEVHYFQLDSSQDTALSMLVIRDVTVDKIGQYECEFTSSSGQQARAAIQLSIIQESSGDIKEGEGSKDGKPKSDTDCQSIKPRRTDLSDLGSPCLFRGWVDVQGQGANNDYCRVILNGGQPYLSCALAGSTDDHVYTSPNKTIDFFDAGHTNTWYMKDVDGDGKDDYCRCVGLTPNTVVSCMKSGDNSFISHDDIQIQGSSGCHYTKVNPFFGVPE